MTQNSIYSENAALLLTINKFKEYLFLTILKRVSGSEHPFYVSAPCRTEQAAQIRNIRIIQQFFGIIFLQHPDFFLFQPLGRKTRHAVHSEL